MEMEVRGSGKRMLEWDLNEWRWDGDLFIASSSSSICSSHEHEDALAFNLGPSTPNPNPNPNPNHILTTKLGAGVISGCQVQNWVADLSKAKDYHRRHKVCQIHYKSTHALVNNILQRFCQQCSRSSSSIAYIKIIRVIEIIIEIRVTIINIIIIAVERHIIIGVVTFLFIASSLAIQIINESNRLKSIMLSAPKPATSRTGYWYGAKSGRARQAASFPENVTAD